ncbi:MAG: hypothetical protein M2R45_02604 [Verrucomicrobia subdivision 3 bacterium]|nr:hypothetical protein [Limisphaerales bacterium]MCS1416428.1 hypothetical protein [Limisphaerales bacterium]
MMPEVRLMESAMVQVRDPIGLAIEMEGTLWLSRTTFLPTIRVINCSLRGETLFRAIT